VSLSYTIFLRLLLYALECLRGCRRASASQKLKMKECFFQGFRGIRAPKAWNGYVIRPGLQLALDCRFPHAARRSER
jgi:hypothetical protein